MTEVADAMIERSGDSAGALLRAGREKQGLHLAALAAALKVQPHKLELLEADRYDELLDATFTRALAQSMCRVLKIDPAPVLARLPQTGVHGGLEQVARGLGQPFRDRGARHETADWRRFVNVPAIGALLLLGGALALWLMPSKPLNLDALLTPASAPATVAAVDAAASAAEAASVPAGVTPAASVAVTETVFSSPTAETQAGAASAPATDALLALRARTATWVEVRDREGRALLYRTLTPGETIGVDGALPLKVTIGNAEGFELSFRGQPVSLAAATKDNVARLELK